MMEGTVVMIYLIMIIVLNVFVIKTIQVNFSGYILVTLKSNLCFIEALLTTYEPQPPKNHLGHDSYCNNHNNTCGIGEGDCDLDLDCKENLVCGYDNCNGSTFDSTDDCCDVPTKILDCDGGDSCCTFQNLCDIGEGDCDSDFDCMGELVCGFDNCDGPNFDSTDDCCTVCGPIIDRYFLKKPVNFGSAYCRSLANNAISNITTMVPNHE